MSSPSDSDSSGRRKRVATRSGAHTSKTNCEGTAAGTGQTHLGEDGSFANPDSAPGVKHTPR